MFDVYSIGMFQLELLNQLIHNQYFNGCPIAQTGSKNPHIVYFAIKMVKEMIKADIFPALIQWVYAAEHFAASPERNDYYYYWLLLLLLFSPGPAISSSGRSWHSGTEHDTIYTRGIKILYFATNEGMNMLFLANPLHCTMCSL